MTGQLMLNSDEMKGTTNQPYQDMKDRTANQRTATKTGHLRWLDYTLLGSPGQSYQVSCKKKSMVG
jgi:hypothetical protein